MALKNDALSLFCFEFSIYFSLTDLFRFEFSIFTLGRKAGGPRMSVRGPLSHLPTMEHQLSSRTFPNYTGPRFYQPVRDSEELCSKLYTEIKVITYYLRKSKNFFFICWLEISRKNKNSKERSCRYISSVWKTHKKYCFFHNLSNLQNYLK